MSVSSPQMEEQVPDLDCTTSRGNINKGRVSNANDFLRFVLDTTLGGAHRARCLPPRPKWRVWKRAVWDIDCATYSVKHALAKCHADGPYTEEC